jgi:AraC-like DNA-binding protein
VSRVAVQTRDLDLAHELLSEAYAAHRPHYSGSRERFRFSLVSTATGSIASDALSHSMGTVAAVETVRHLTVAHLMGGGVAIERGHDEARWGPDDVFLYPYGTNFVVRWDTMDQSVIRLDFDKVARFATATTGTDTALRFLGMRPITPEMGQYWRTVTGFVHRELVAPSSTITEPLVLAQVEDTLSAAALSVFPNTILTAQASVSPIGQVGPATLRRAMGYIDSHAGEAITLADIAADAGVSARVLQRSFVAHHGSTPMGYLRRVRLEHAHQQLQAGDPALDTVDRIASRWGFTTQRRFAQDYRRAYGVDPSHTLHT